MYIPVGFLIGGLLGRIAGNIAQDWFENNTETGREIVKRKQDAQLEKQRQLSQIEFENKMRISEIEHRRKLDDMQKQFELNRVNAEAQMLLAYSDWQQKVFWEKCFPLRNPFEVPMGYDPVYEENTERLKECRLKTVILPNNKQIVPLRVIVALKDNVHPHAATVNGNLSMFIVNNFSANGEHAAISEIGAWKEEIPVNDASINYLFKGLKGQPVVVVVPIYTNFGTLVRFKVWSWGLGEKLQYPVGFDFGWLDLDAIYYRVLAREVELFSRTFERIGETANKTFERDLKILSAIKNNRCKLQRDDVTRLLSMLDVPKEVNGELNRKTHEIASSVYSCIVGMYIDGYHLFEYGTEPILPKLLTSLRGSRVMFRDIRDYYITLINLALGRGILTPRQAVQLVFELGENAKLVGCSNAEISPICENIDFLLLKTENSVGIKENYRELLQHKSELLTNKN